MNISSEIRTRPASSRRTKRANDADTRETNANPFAPFEDSFRDANLSPSAQYDVAERLTAALQNDTMRTGGVPRTSPAQQLLIIAADERTAVHVREGLFRRVIDSIGPVNPGPGALSGMWIENAARFAVNQRTDPSTALRTLLTLCHAFRQIDTQALAHVQREVFSALKQIIKNVALHRNDAFRVADSLVATAAVDRPMYTKLERRYVLAYVTHVIANSRCEAAANAVLFERALGVATVCRSLMPEGEVLRLAGTSIALLQDVNLETPLKAALLKRTLQTILEKKPLLPLAAISDLSAVVASLHPLATIPPNELSEIYSGLLRCAAPLRHPYFGNRAERTAPSPYIRRHLQNVPKERDAASADWKRLHKKIATVLAHGCSILERKSIDGVHAEQLMKAAAGYLGAHAREGSTQTQVAFLAAAEQYQARRTSEE